MNLLIQLLEKSEAGLRKLKNYISSKTDNHFRELRKWYADDPRNLKRTTFDFLEKNSIVFDLGGYQGEWTSDIYARYNCNVYIFEPVAEYIEVIKNRFKKNEKIKPFPFGLNNITADAFILLNEFASKINSNPIESQTEKIHLVSFTDFVKENDIVKIDLIKINIEGSEYSLLNHIIESNYIKSINTLLIQFHDFEKNANTDRITIQNSLEKTHSKIFDYPFVWECWQIRSTMSN